MGTPLVCAIPKGFVFPLRKNSASHPEVVFLANHGKGAIVWLVAHPQGESRALEAAVSKANVIFAVGDMATFLSPIYTIVQRPGDLVVFPSGCFYQGLCCDHSTVGVATFVPPFAPQLLPALGSDDEYNSPPESPVDPSNALPLTAPPSYPNFHPVVSPITARRSSPFSLFPTIRQILAEAGASGIEVFHIVDLISRDARFVRTLPSHMSSTIAVLLALNFLKAREHAKSNSVLEKQYVAPLKSSDHPGVPTERVKWRWVGEKATKERIADILFELETAYWFAITRHMFRVDVPKRLFEITYEVGGPKPPPDTQLYSSSQKLELHAQEQLRFAHPEFAFEYRVTGHVPVCVGPIDNVTSVTMKNTHLASDRPPAAKVTTLVADAAARLPGGVGSRADVERLLLDSRYGGAELHSNPDLVRNTVTGALDRMSRTEDPPVKFCREVKLWVYRYRQRVHGDFSSQAEEEPPLRLRPAKRPRLLATTSAPSLTVQDTTSALELRAEAEKDGSQLADGKVLREVVLECSPTVVAGAPQRARYTGPALMTATKMPGLRTIWWTAPGNRRPAFSGLPPRRVPRKDAYICPQAYDRIEGIYRTIRDARRDGAEVEKDALTLRTFPAAVLGQSNRRDLVHHHKAGSNSISSRKRRAAADASSASTTAIIMMNKRSASATHQATVAAAEAVAHHLLSEAVVQSTAPALNLRALETDAFDEYIFDPAKRFSVPIYFKDSPHQVFRSNQTDPSYLVDTSVPAIDDVQDLPIFSASAFDSITRFGSIDDPKSTAAFCFHLLDQIDAEVTNAIRSYSEAVLESHAFALRVSRRRNSSTDPLVDEDSPFVVRPSASLASSIFHTADAMRTVELPSAVGYIHWLQDLENAVDERLWYHDWRPKARFSQKIKNDKAPEALLLADPWRLYEAKSRTILPCNAVESSRVWYTSCACLPELFLHHSRVLLPWPAPPPPEIGRYPLPPDGSWAPFPWSTLYEEDVLYEEPPLEEGRKKRRFPFSRASADGATDDLADVVPAGKRRAAARAAAAVRSSFEDSGDEEDRLPLIRKTTAAEASSLGKKRKREDVDYVTTSPQAKKRPGIPLPPKSEDEKRREKLFAASKQRRRSVALPGPETAPHLCCRVVLMKIRGKPWWPASLLTRDGLHHFALKHFSGGEYVWPFRPDESYPWVSEKCISTCIPLSLPN